MADWSFYRHSDWPRCGRRAFAAPGRSDVPRAISVCESAQNLGPGHDRTYPAGVSQDESLLGGTNSSLIVLHSLLVGLVYLGGIGSAMESMLLWGFCAWHIVVHGLRKNWPMSVVWLLVCSVIGCVGLIDMPLFLYWAQPSISVGLLLLLWIWKPDAFVSLTNLRVRYLSSLALTRR